MKNDGKDSVQVLLAQGENRVIYVLKFIVKLEWFISYVKVLSRAQIANYYD